MKTASYVLSHLNPDDLRETLCQTQVYDPVQLAQAALASPYTYVATGRRGPAVIFGAHPLCSSTVSAWALGTKHGWRHIPEVGRFCNGPLRQQLKADGYRWAEARSITGHDAAHRWIRALGGVATMALDDYGNDGENFVLFRGRL